MTEQFNVPSLASIHVDDAALANDRVRARYMALTTPLQPITVDVARVVATTLVVTARVRTLAQTARQLPDFDASCFDDLEDVALAAWFTHVTKGKDGALDAQVLAAHAVDLRDKLLTVAQMCVSFGIFSSELLAPVTHGQGYRDAASDLVVLGKVLRSVWSHLAGRTLLVEADLDAAARFATALLAVTGVKDNGSADLVDSARNHQRAFTLLVRTYDQVRRAVQFLRWNDGDADDIAPSLFVRDGSPRKTNTDAATAVSADKPVEPQPVTAGADAGAQPGIATGTTATEGGPFAA